MDYTRGFRVRSKYPKMSYAFMAGSQFKARKKAAATRRKNLRIEAMLARTIASKAANPRTGGYLGIEKKFFDTFYTATALTAAWAGGECDPAANTLFAPTKGTGPSDRDGDHVMIKTIDIRGNVYRGVGSDLADVSIPAYVTVVLVQDKQTNGAQLNAEDVMVDTAPKHLSHRNLQYSRRFIVLKSMRISLHDTAAGADGANTMSVTGSGRTFNWRVQCNIPVDFIGNAGTVADIGNNSLHIIACTNNTAYYLEYSSRIRFVG